MNSTEQQPPGAPKWTGAALAVLVVLTAVELGHAWVLSRRVDEVRISVQDLSRALDAAKAASRPAAGATGTPAGAGPRTGPDLADSLDDKVDALRGDFDLLTNDVQRLERKIDDLTAQLENRGAVSSDAPQPPDLDWTEPTLFEAARKGAESVGFTLTKDEVRCPARLVLREGALEYFAVLKGGKEHETLVSLVGNTLPEARRAKDMAVKLNNALQALGFKRGKPIRFTPNGTQPAEGEPIFIFVEWTTGGKTELVRAEDIVWHQKESRPMKAGSWVYVGSLFVAGETRGSLEYAADLTAEVACTYSAPSTIIDTTEPDAQDDTIFLSATPRIPQDVVNCTVIFRRKDLKEGVKVFPPVPTGGEDGGGRK
jgi:hypothetical protein